MTKLKQLWAALCSDDYFRAGFLMRHAEDSPRRDQLAQIEHWRAKGLDTSDRVVDAFVRKWGLGGRYPTYLRIPAPSVLFNRQGQKPRRRKPREKQ